MTTKGDNSGNEIRKSKYELVPPDGGYGYVITISLFCLFISSFIPNTCFGIIFGSYLSSQTNDEVGAVTFANSIFNTVFHFVGFLANPLLLLWPQRVVALLGGGLLFLGNIGTIFFKTLNHLTFTFGILEGLGVGFLVPSVMTAFNDYFLEKKNFMMGLCQTFICAITIFYPTFSRFLLEQYGFRGTVAIFAALTAHSLFGAVSLQPVEWHMRKKEIEYENGICSDQKENVEKNDSVQKETDETEMNHLLPHPHNVITNASHLKNSIRMNQTRPSVISIGSVSVFVDDHDRKSKEGFWKSLIKHVDYSLLKDLLYYNLIVGVSLPLLSELNFIAILPTYLKKNYYSENQISMVMTVYLGSDLVGRLCFTILMALVNPSNRLIFWTNTCLCFLFRIAFTLHSNYWWIIITSGALGMLRGFIHIPLALVIAEEYPDRFSSAFTLYMAVCGLVSFIVGLAIKFVKSLTNDDKMVMHLLAALFAIVSITWAVEMMYKKIKKTNKSNRKNGDN